MALPPIWFRSVSKTQSALLSSVMQDPSSTPSSSPVLTGESEDFALYIRSKARTKNMRLHSAYLFLCLHPDKPAVPSFFSFLVFIYIMQQNADIHSKDFLLASHFINVYVFLYKKKTLPLNFIQFCAIWKFICQCAWHFPLFFQL